MCFEIHGERKVISDSGDQVVCAAPIPSLRCLRSPVESSALHLFSRPALMTAERTHDHDIVGV